MKENDRIRLANGNVVTQATYKVSGLPFFALLSDNIENSIEQIKGVFNSILSEIYLISSGKNCCFEMIWETSEQVNQSYVSNLNMYFVIKTFSPDEYSCDLLLNNIASSIVSALSNKKIFLEQIFGFELGELIRWKQGMDRVRFFRKNECVKNFNNYYCPQCYAVDNIFTGDSEMDDLINYLINCRNTVYVVSLMPTQLSNFESSYIEQMCATLSALTNGIHNPSYGMIIDKSVDETLQIYTQQKTNLQNNAFILNSYVISTREHIDTLSSKIAVLYSTAKDDISSRTYCYENQSAYQIILNNKICYSWILAEENMKVNRLQFVNLSTYFYRMPFLISSKEACEIFRLPIGSKKISAGLNIIDIEKRNKTYSHGIINDADIILGTMQNVSNSTNTSIGFNLKDLTRHMLVVGVPGQGKSTFLIGLMDRLWKNHQIPFLVIEPAKNEYRSLIESIPELQVFSPGKSNVAPYIINPFIPPKGVTLEIYKSIIKSAFSTAFEMWTPLDQLFDETLNICYSDNGWLDETTIDDNKECFTLPDFIATYKKVVNSKGYTAEYKKQIETAGVLRLNGLLEQNVNIFDNLHTVPIQDIFTKPTVIELSNIKDIKQKSFIIAFLLSNIYAFVEANFKNDGNLKNAILLEEAHVLLSGDNVSSNSEGESANVAAVRLLSNMLAEIRSRGVGIIIADQSSRKVSSEVISNTNLKISFRLVEERDRSIIKSASVMDEVQYERLAKLKTGQAMVYFDKLDETEEVQFDDYRLLNGISTDLSDAFLKERMKYWSDKQHILMPFVECKELKMCEKKCNQETRSKARMIADVVFRKTYNIYYKNQKEFIEFFPKINSIISETITKLLGPINTKDLMVCVKIHLLRKINYETQIEISKASRIKYAKSLNVNWIGAMKN